MTSHDASERARFVADERWQRVAINDAVEKIGSTALREVIKSKTVESVIADYEASDIAAKRSQAAYFRWGSVALSATTVGTVVGALALLFSDSLLGSTLRSWISGLQTAAIVIAFLIVKVLSKLRPVEVWYGKRAQAEMLRGEIFGTVLRKVLGSGQPALAVQGLKLVELAYVGDQIRFFKSAIARHETTLKWHAPFRLLGYALVALGVAIGLASYAQILVTLNVPVLNIVAAMAIRFLDLIPADPSKAQLSLVACGSSLLAYASARSMMRQDRRNAALYKSTLSQLETLMKDKAHGLDAARVAVSSGRHDFAVTFFEATQDMLRQDHVAWLGRQPTGNPISPPSHPLEPITS